MAQRRDLQLSNHDQRMLDLAFGRHDAAKKFQVKANLPSDQNISDGEYVKLLVTKEIKAVRLDKAGRTQEAYDLISGIIEEAPMYASAYNNRAQLNRLLHPEDTQAAIEDLNTAITLARPMKEDGVISQMQADVLRNAYGQLAAIYVRKSQLSHDLTTSWQMQTRASDMMVHAAEYGEEIANSVAASLNPYAKLCGSMLESILKQER